MIKLILKVASYLPHLKSQPVRFCCFRFRLRLEATSGLGGVKAGGRAALFRI